MNETAIVNIVNDEAIRSEDKILSKWFTSSGKSYYDFIVAECTAGVFSIFWLWPWTSISALLTTCEKDFKKNVNSVKKSYFSE